jgi:hypothetical protein
MKSGIYTLTWGQYFYVGKSIDIEKRWKQHSDKFAKGTHSKRLQEMYYNYGEPEYTAVFLCHPDHTSVLETVVLNLKKTADGIEFCLNGADTHPVGATGGIVAHSRYLTLSLNDILNKVSLAELEARNAIAEKAKAVSDFLRLRDEGQALPNELTELRNLLDYEENKRHKLLVKYLNLDNKVDEYNKRSFLYRLFHKV